MKMNLDFTGKVCLVTGSSSGIGAGTAELFSKCGASLVITGRNEENLKEVANKCKESSPKKLEPLVVVCEMSKEDDVVNLVNQTIEHYGKLNILVNNAGMYSGGNSQESTLNQFDVVMNVNLRSVFQLTKLCIPYLIKEKGSVVNTSSLYAIRAEPGSLIYSTSKAALDQFTRCTALELAPHGVRINAVNPGHIMTPTFERGGLSKEDLNNMIEQWKEIYPLGRHGEVKEVASSIVFLASEQASFITGVTLPVDGGINLACPR